MSKTKHTPTPWIFDDLLAACNLALAGLMQPRAIDFEVLEEKLRTVIAEAESK